MKSYTKHIAVFGSARSGTSWLAEIIARQHRYRLLFEPEHPINTKKGKLISDVYLTKNQNDKQIDAYLKQVFLSLCDFFNLEQLENIHDEYTRPSSKTHPKSAIRSNKEAKQKLESADIKKINTILDIFESQQYPRE